MKTLTLLIFLKRTHFLSMTAMVLLFPWLIFASEPARQVKATIIQFNENEPGVGRFPVTMTVTAEYLRIDDTTEKKDFVLFARKENIIYSVNSEDQQIVTVKYRPVKRKPPFKLNTHLKIMPQDNKAPEIEGKPTRHYRLIVNNKTCENIVTAAGLLPDVVQAMKSFKQVLAGQQAETLPYLPADVHEACDLTKNTFHPGWTLDKGFPVLEISHDGYSRVLSNYFQQQVDGKLFVLPSHYRVLNLN